MTGSELLVADRNAARLEIVLRLMEASLNGGSPAMIINASNIEDAMKQAKNSVKISFDMAELVLAEATVQR